MKALGMLEVYSFTTAVVAADICAKAADVKIIAFDRTRPGSADVPAPLVMQVKLSGNVAAVKAAIEAGKEYAESVVEMFGGKKEEIEVKCPISLLDTVIELFGKDIKISKINV